MYQYIYSYLFVLVLVQEDAMKAPDERSEAGGPARLSDGVVVQQWQTVVQSTLSHIVLWARRQHKQGLLHLNIS